MWQAASANNVRQYLCTTSIKKIPNKIEFTIQKESFSKLKRDPFFVDLSDRSI